MAQEAGKNADAATAGPVSWEGIAIRPFYMGQHVTRIATTAQPSAAKPNWLLRQDFEVHLPELAEALKNAIVQDVACIGLDISGATAAVDTSKLKHIAQALLAAQQAATKPVQLLVLNIPSAAWAAALRQEVANAANIKLVAVGADGIMASLTSTQANVQQAVAASTDVLKTLAQGEQWLLSAMGLQEAGATAVQQLGVLMALNRLYTQQVGDKPVPLVLELGIGRNFLLEIAKLRAARQLFAQQGNALAIHARSVRWNKSATDVHANLLRTTAEAMSGVLGGADAVSILPYNVLKDAPSADGMRLARNIQHVLRHESHLGAVADAAAGAYFIEWLTQEVATRALQFGTDIEAKGGLGAPAAVAYVQVQIAEAAHRTRNEIAQGTLPLLNYKPAQKPYPQQGDQSGVPTPWRALQGVE